MIKQTGKMKSLNCIFFVFEKRLNKAKEISITEEANIKANHLGAVWAFTKDELLRNKTPKQSKKRNKTVI